MARVNWSEGGEGHLLPEETGKGQEVVSSRKLERGKNDVVPKNADGARKTMWQRSRK